MNGADGITGHYTSGTLMDRLRAAVADDGHDPDNPTIEALAPYDQFHGRGMEATVELADDLKVSADHHLLDVGSGIGGPARYIADRFGCRVTGIDLTDEFCAVARTLTKAMNMEASVAIEQGDALQMPFADASFDGAYSMNVSMNIEDKAAFYREIHRVVKPGGWLVLSEIARGTGPEPDYPAPWALTAETSFLSTPDETLKGLEAARFEVKAIEDKVAQSRAFAAKVREIVESGGKPPHRAVQLIHGELGLTAAENMAASSREGRILPIEVMCVRR